MSASDNVITVRTIVDLPEPERDQLDALCRQRGISRAEALRQALRHWLAQQQPSHSAVFGLWRDRPADVLELQHALRAEMSWWGVAQAKPKSFKPGLKASPACPLMTP
jgi:Arc/MetJ-type ribon-helix-helix transcriptional regulator